jgi:tetratricopeptide (TPR) repeat protein
LDFAILSAKLEVQLALPATLSDARQRAILRLDEARELCGVNPWLDLEEQEYSTEKTQRSPEKLFDRLPTPTSAWESYALGQWLMRHDRIVDAQRQFAIAVDLAPNEFWSNFQMMRCNFELGNIEKALISANVCIALQPRRSECYYNRAQCHVALSHDQQALDDFGRSLQLDPNFAPTLLARGKMLGQLNRFAEAQADLESAAEHGAKPAEAHYQMARLCLARNDRAQASRWLQRTLTDDPDHMDAAALQKELEVRGP